MFNDVIIRAALDFRADVLELRAVCTQARDFANPIEPSREGGRRSLTQSPPPLAQGSLPPQPSMLDPAPANMRLNLTAAVGRLVPRLPLASAG